VSHATRQPGHGKYNYLDAPLCGILYCYRP
jgi:hypothetical protein